MRRGLSHSVKIEACLDPMQPPLQSFSIGAVDPGKTIERRHVGRGRRASLDLAPRRPPPRRASFAHHYPWRRATAARREPLLAIRRDHPESVLYPSSRSLLTA